MPTVKTKPVKLTEASRDALRRIADAGGKINKSNVGGFRSPGPEQYHHNSVRNLVRVGMLRETKTGYTITAAGKKALG